MGSNQTSQLVDPSTINTSIITRHLRNRLMMLRNLRQGFIDQHGAEPSVSLRYSDQSTSNSTISLNADNMTSGDSSLTAPKNLLYDEDSVSIIILNKNRSIDTLLNSRVLY